MEPGYTGGIQARLTDSTIGLVLLSCQLMNTVRDRNNLGYNNLNMYWTNHAEDVCYKRSVIRLIIEVGRSGPFMYGRIMSMS